MGYLGQIDLKGHKVDKQSMSIGFVQTGMSLMANL